jgi:hypothetical protein
VANAREHNRNSGDQYINDKQVQSGCSDHLQLDLSIFDASQRAPLICLTERLTDDVRVASSVLIPELFASSVAALR